VTNVGRLFLSCKKNHVKQALLDDFSILLDGIFTREKYFRKKRKNY
jgi:hypothetical protein